MAREKDPRLPVSVLVKKQLKTLPQKIFNNGKEKIVVDLRYDDSCGNGHNEFAITASGWEKDQFGRWRESFGGCCHDIIAEQFPELKKYIKWHLTSSDGPWGYIGNTIYLADDKDCWGLRKGESRQLRRGGTGPLCWILTPVEGAELERYVDSETQPEGRMVYEYKPWCRIGEGKERQIEAARETAIWPEATLEQLLDKDALNARLPALMEEFKKDMEELGFVY